MGAWAISEFLWPDAQSKGISAVLAKDAFLVFRALCKLSTRSSESSTGTDPTAVRGKVGCHISCPCSQLHHAQHTFLSLPSFCQLNIY